MDRKTTRLITTRYAMRRRDCHARRKLIRSTDRSQFAATANAGETRSPFKVPRANSARVRYNGRARTQAHVRLSECSMCDVTAAYTQATPGLAKSADGRQPIGTTTFVHHNTLLRSPSLFPTRSPPLVFCLALLALSSRPELVAGSRIPRGKYPGIGPEY